jgi:hypothetical protein
VDIEEGTEDSEMDSGQEHNMIEDSRTGTARGRQEAGQQDSKRQQKDNEGTAKKDLLSLRANSVGKEFSRTI